MDEIRNEERLLLLISRLRFSEKAISELTELTGKITDWKYFEYLVNAHGVVSLVQYNIEKTGLSALVPSNTLAFLKNGRLLSMTRNAFQFEMISEVLGTLNDSRIKTVLIKGIALELSVYGNTGLRQMTDIDILIRKEDCLRARELLLARGYESFRLKSWFHRPIMLYAGKHMPTLLKNGSSVDIHHDLFGGTRNNLTLKMIGESSPVEIGKFTAWMPHPQLLFIYLVKHLVQHELNGESQIRLYTDLVVLLENYYNIIINPDLFTLASLAGLEKRLAVKLNLLKEYWNIELPDWIIEIISKHSIRDSGYGFVYFLKSPRNNKVKSKGESYRINLREIPGLHRKLLYILGDLFPTVSFMKDRYNCKFSITALVYYPHRFGKLLRLFF